MPAKDQGADFTRYLLVPRTLIFLTCGDRLLLVKGSPNKRLWAGLYNGLGGHVEQGEDVLSAAYRELREEAGLEGVPLWLCGVITIDTGQVPGVAVFVLRGETGQADLFASAEGQPEWVPVSRLPDLPLVEDLTTLLPRLLAMQPGTAPFAAHYSYDHAGALHIHFAGDGDPALP